MTDVFGAREHPLAHSTSFLSGVDLAAETSENVLAVADGIVISCKYDETYGNSLTLEHTDGVQTQYAYLQEFQEFLV